MGTISHRIIHVIRISCPRSQDAFASWTRKALGGLGISELLGQMDKEKAVQRKATVKNHPGD